MRPRALRGTAVSVVGGRLQSRPRRRHRIEAAVTGCAPFLQHPVLELGGVQLHQRFEGDDRVKSGIAEMLMTDGIEVEVPQLQGPLDAVELEGARQVVPTVDLLTV